MLNSLEDVTRAAAAFSVHKDKYSAEQQTILSRRIRAHANRLTATVDLAGPDGTTDFGTNTTGEGQATKKGQKGKTRAQPRAFGGKFGKKGKTNGEQAMPGADQMEPPPPDPMTFIAVANNLQIGQSVALPHNMAKVKRLGSGYQLYKMDDSENRVVKTLAEVHTWIKSLVKGGADRDSNQPPA